MCFGFLEFSDSNFEDSGFLEFSDLSFQGLGLRPAVQGPARDPPLP